MMPAAAESLTVTQVASELAEIEQELRKRSLLGSLSAFVRAAWSVVEPTAPLVWNWHLDALCALLESVSHNELQRVLINVPPGTMKSLLVSVFWPAWEWAHDASLRYLTASYGAHLTIDQNRKVRDIVTSDWYQDYFDVRLSQDQNAKVRFNTSAGGWRIATSVNGVGTGEHPDRIIIDDPTTADQARSDAERNAANDWFDRTISSRGVARNATIIVVMQRLHEDDLSGHLLARGGFEHVCWPMRYEITRNADPLFRPDPRDIRTVAGELLWPSLFTEEKVKRLEIDLGPYGTAGQMQQRPAPEGGGLFQRGWFRFVESLPVTARRCRGWDTASTEGGGDYTVGVRISEVEDKFYVEDVVRGQYGAADVDSMIRTTAVADGKLCRQREEEEKGSAGKGVIAARVKTLKGYDYGGVSISGDKVTRARPFRAQCEAGNVYLIRAHWNEAYIQELCGFPVGKHDDQVDASSCAFNALLMEPVATKEWVTW